MLSKIHSNRLLFRRFCPMGMLKLKLSSTCGMRTHYNIHFHTMLKNSRNKTKSYKKSNKFTHDTETDKTFNNRNAKERDFL